MNATAGINVTEVPADLPAAATLPDAHEIRTTYDLSWPGAASFDQALAQNSLQNASQHTLCSLVVYADFAARVIDAYDPDRPYLCDVPLGEACAAAMMESVTAGETDANGCPTNVEIDTLEECADVLGDSPGFVAYAGGRCDGRMRRLDCSVLVAWGADMSCQSSAPPPTPPFVRASGTSRPIRRSTADRTGRN